MNELERNLVALGAELEFPSTPDLVEAVRKRLAAGRRARFALRPVLVAAAAAVILSLAAALAIPSARSALLRFFHLRGVTIERVGTLPQVPAGAGLNLGDLVSRAKAQGEVGFKIALPRLDKTPRSVYVQLIEPLGGQVSVVFRSDSGKRVLFTEFRGSSQPYIYKSAGPGTRIEPVRVGHERGFWLSGAKHVVAVDLAKRPFDERVRLAGNVLVWERQGLALRLEGPISKTEALRIARSVR